MSDQTDQNPYDHPLYIRLDLHYPTPPPVGTLLPAEYYLRPKAQKYYWLIQHGYGPGCTTAEVDPDTGEILKYHTGSVGDVQPRLKKEKEKAAKLKAKEQARAERHNTPRNITPLEEAPSTTINLRIHPEIKKALQAAASRRGMSASAYIKHALTSTLYREGFYK